MKNIIEELKHAFSTKEIELTNDEILFLQELAKKISAKNLSYPAIILLESLKPLNYFGNQLLVALKPIFSLVIDSSKYEKLTSILEKRKSIDYLIKFLEETQFLKEKKCQKK